MVDIKLLFLSFGEIISGMGRKRTKVELGDFHPGEIKQRLRDLTDERLRERLQVLLWAASGKYTLEDLAALTKRSRSTIQNWLDKFHAGGVVGLLEKETPPGLSSPLASARIQSQLRAGLEARRWRSAQEIAAWLDSEHGIKRARKSLYYWLSKNGWKPPGSK